MTHIVSKTLSLILLTTLTGVSTLTSALALSLDNNVAFSVGSGDLASGAGSNFNPTKESSADVQLLDISDASAQNWEVVASISNTSFPPGNLIYVKVSTNGTGATGLTLQTTYLQLSATPQVIASGTGNHTGMGLRYQLGGINVDYFAPGTVYGNVTLNIQSPS